MKVNIFIISWSGQHQNAAKIAEKLDEFRSSLCVVYSDPDPDFEIAVSCRAIRTRNELYWADKFRTCLEAFDSDLLLVLHADCSCDDWALLVNRCVETNRHYPNIGVWAPHIRGTYFEIGLTRLGKIKGTPLSAVAQTDGICFSIHKAIVSRMKALQYDRNLYGWGTAWAMVVAAYCRNMLVVVDEAIAVQHPTKRGYPSEAAHAQMNEFLLQLSLPEKIQYRLLKGYIEEQKRIQRRNLHHTAEQKGA